MLGGFGLTRDGVPVAPEAWQRPMAARVVRFLLVRREHVQEDLLLEAFWRDSDPVAARRSLAVSLSRCRAVLRPGAIVASERAYRLVIEADDRVDVQAFEDAAAFALELPAGPARTDALERAASLWTGEPLPEDRYADWTFQWRDALTDQHREVLAALADARAAAGEHGAALRMARRMLDADPLDEGAHRRVMAGVRRARPARPRAGAVPALPPGPRRRGGHRARPRDDGAARPDPRRRRGGPRSVSGGGPEAPHRPWWSALVSASSFGGPEGVAEVIRRRVPWVSGASPYRRSIVARIEVVS